MDGLYPYTRKVPVIFDSDEEQANVAKHGLSLGDAENFDFASSVIVEDDRRDYGERRLLGFCRMGGQGRCLVFVVVDNQTIRAISYRRARDKELRRYGLS